MVNHRRGKSVMINQRIGTQGTPLMFIQPQNMAQNMVLTYLHQLDPEDLPLSHQDFFGFVSGSWRLPWCFTEVWMPTLGFTPFHSMGTGSRNGRGIFHGYILILVPQRSPKSYHRWEMNGNRWNRMSFFIVVPLDPQLLFETKHWRPRGWPKSGGNRWSIQKRTYQDISQFFVGKTMSYTTQSTGNCNHTTYSYLWDGLLLFYPHYSMIKLDIPILRAVYWLHPHLWWSCHVVSTRVVIM